MIKRYSLCVVVVTIILFSCTLSYSQIKNRPYVTYGMIQVSNPDSPVNHLNARQKIDGWLLLFNGKNMQGWRGYQHKSVSAWNVDHGTLHCNGKKGAPSTDLITEGQYANFILTIQWKISHAANSGIMFHVNENYPYTFTSGPEYQIIDDKGWLGKLEPW